MLKDLVHTFGTNALMVPVGLLAGILTARYLGPHDRGILAIFLMIPVTARAFTMMGLDTASIYLHRREQVAFGVVFANCVWFSIGIGVLTAAAVFAGRAWLPGGVGGESGVLLLISLAIIPSELLVHYLGPLARAVGKFAAANFRSVIHKVLNLAAVILIFMVFGGGLRAYLLCHLAIQVVIVLWLARDLYADARGSFRPDLAVMRRMLRFGTKHHATVLAWHAHSRADLYLIAIYLSKPEIAFYAIAAGLAERVFTVTDVMSQVIFPRLTAVTEREGAQLTARGARNVILVGVLVVVPLCLFASPILRVLYGPEYLPAVGPMYILVGGVVVIAMSRVLNQYLLSTNLHHYSAVITGGAAALNIGLNVMLIPRMGMMGAALSSVFTYTAQGLAFLYVFNRFSGVPIRDALFVSRDDLRYLLAIPAQMRLRRLARSTPQ